MLVFVIHSYDEAAGTMDSGYPRSIEQDFPGMSDEVDAAAFQYGIMKLQISHFQYNKAYKLNSTFILLSFICIPLCCLAGYLYFYHGDLQYEYSYTHRKVTRIMRTNSFLNC